MAWRMKNESDGTIFYLIVNKEITIGRKDTDLIILNDQSISRKHASIFITHLEFNLTKPDRIPVVTLKDATSKYGTFVNGEQVSPDGKIVKKDDIVTFGQCGTDYRLIYDPIVVTTSCVDTTDKIILKNAVWTVGGHLVPEWRKDCTHLVMTEVKVTIKAACAMVSLKPLVTIQYFAELARKCNSSDRPIPKNYIPKLGETAIEQDNVTFDIVPERKELFKDKIFLFLSTKQYKKLTFPLTISGASTIIVEKNDINKYEEVILKPEVCVIQFQATADIDEETKTLFGKIESILLSNNRRLIPESDIGLAVVQCSTKRFCNPDYILGDSMSNVTKLDSQSFTQNQIFAANTEDPENSIRPDGCSSNVFDLERKPLPQVIDVNENIVTSISSVDTTLPIPEVMEDLPEIKTKRSRPPSSETEAPVSKAPRLSAINVPSVADVISIDPATTTRADIKVEPTSQPESPIAFDNASTQPLLSNEVKMELLESPDVTSEKSEVSYPGRVSGANTSNQTTSGDQQFLSNAQPPGSRSNKFEDNDGEGNLSNLMVVEFASLVKPKAKNAQTNCQRVEDSSVINFKKFKKVQHQGANRLPRIIGGTDLMLFDKNNQIESQEEDVWMDDYGSQQSQPKNNDTEDWI